MFSKEACIYNKKESVKFGKICYLCKNSVATA